MLRTLSPQEMKRVEARAMEQGLVTGEALMQRAAAHVAAAVKKRMQQASRVLVVCGTGNNGGDGLAAARLLAVGPEAPAIILWLMEGALSPDASRELTRLQREAPQVQLIRLEGESGEPTFICPPLPPKLDCLVDALLGTGLSRPVKGMAAALCQRMEEAYRQGIPVIAVDIPSGLNGATGQPMGQAVHATETVTFHRPKTGLYLAQGPNHAGEVTLGDIGLLPAWDDAPGFWVAQPQDIPGFFPPRRRVSHKGSYGRVLVVAGSRGMAGAAALCALAALRTGAGLVTVACPDDILDVVQQLCPCATCIPLPHKDGDAAWALLLPALMKADSLAIGCGLGRETWAKKLLTRITQEMEKGSLRGKPAAWDADGLNLLAEIAPTLSPSCIVTPHPAEAARMLGLSTGEVLADAPKAARSLQAKYGAAVVLKGTASVLVCGQQEGLNVLGTPAMAKGGSGDALTGVLAALLAGRAQGTLPLEGLSLLQAGTALHGLAGMAAARTYGERGMLATDLVMELGRVAP